MAKQNSQIQAKGVGKNSKRHDLDGTPGLSEGSSLQQGDVQQLEAGVQAVQNTQGAQAQQSVERAQPAPAGIDVPDPVSFAKERFGGGSEVPQQTIQPLDTAEFMPMLRRLATGNSSSILKQAYMDMVSNLQQRPWSGASTAVIDRQALDRNVEKAF